MKKFFGIVGLIFCVFLASCNFSSLSNKTGSLEFSIPVNDIIKSYNQNAARSGDNEIGTDTFQAVCLIQVKGSRSYYKSKIDSKTFTPADVSNNKIYLNFSFDQVPSGQSYTVMFDFFITDDSEETNKIVPNMLMPIFTGKQDNVFVAVGRTTNVDLPASYMKENFLGVKVDFANGTSKVYKGLSFFEEDAMDGIDYTDPNAYARFEEMQDSLMVLLTKDGNKLYLNNHSNPAPLEVNDISYVIDSNSNFTDSSFKYKVYYEGDEGGYTSKALDFNNNVCSIKSFLMSTNFFYSGCVVAEKGNYQIIVPTASISYYATGQQGGGHNPYYGYEPTYGYADFTGQNALRFTKKENSNPPRYICNLPLQTLLGNNTLSNGDTLVITLQEVALNSIFTNVTNFYYKLQKDDISGLSDDILYKDNNCNVIGYLEYNMNSFVMPLNYVDNVEQNPNIMFFFDKDGSEDNLDLACIVTYQFFSASQKYLAFKTAIDTEKTEQEKELKLRYEIELPLKDNQNRSLSLSGGQTVTVTVSGQVISSSYQSMINLNGEIFDAAPFNYKNDPEDESEPVKTSYFRSLSKDTSNPPSVRNIEVSGAYGGLNSSYIFYDIQTPKSADDLNSGFTNDFRLLLTVPCENAMSTLMIENFGMFASNN